ncbi:sugar transferase [Devosia faecipullorum]|uniref:sugar transferase n=1 Tax=Devosia faecipullorum TaxID=2755039 RepID=UPI002ED79C67
MFTLNLWRGGQTAQAFADETQLHDTTDLHIISKSGLPSFWIEGIPAAAEPSATRSVNVALKRIFDIAFAFAALAALAPLFILVALAIKLSDRGPVFFTQPRVGKDGKSFQIIKFRSMYVEACDYSGAQQTVAGDHRVMPIGQVLRKTSIDELPQLVNILRGEMSVVGPRPHVSDQIAAGRPYVQVVPYYDYRHAMLPGLTGWAQANGFRGPTVDWQLAKDRIDHDVAYIQNFSFVLDLRIILKTAIREFFTGSGF